jgi:5-methylcytosine-specific restriction endonuclease McrA
VTRTPGRATVAHTDYEAYIRSSAWRSVRARFIASKLSKVCAGCKQPWGRGDHLHHRTYKNLGAERLMDLVPLCQPCHVKVHQLYDSDPKWRQRGLWYATKAALKEPQANQAGGSNPRVRGCPDGRG